MVTVLQSKELTAVYKDDTLVYTASKLDVKRDIEQNIQRIADGEEIVERSSNFKKFKDIPAKLPKTKEPKAKSE